MKLHEYQSKQYFRQYDIPVPNGFVVGVSDDWRKTIDSLDHYNHIVKAQIHAGGRGKAGGIIWAKSKKQLHDACNKLLGTNLKTHQTLLEGLPVHHLLIEEPVDISRELYLGMVVDRTLRSLIVVASTEGGVNIERVAAKNPDLIVQQPIGLGSGIKPYQCRLLAKRMNLSAELSKSFCQILKNLYAMFIASDASMIEINPLVLTQENKWVALDAKISMDENAMFRHPDWKSMIDPSQQSKFEIQAEQYQLNYVKLDGHIGCIVNGAGLAMATMDLITLFGGQPANFLDVGGDTDSKRVAVAFKLLMSDPDVQAIFVNIFGGIVRCDVIANGIIHALEEVELKVPVVVLLQGTNADVGRDLLQNIHPLIEPVEDLLTGASTAIRFLKT